MSFGNQPITHQKHGNGIVLADQGELLLVDFGGTILCVRAADVRRLRSVEQAIAEGSLDDPLRTLCRLQGETIASANAQWGVYTRSRIALLPHQLWVCRKALERWPVRLMIADDVGLGKTIEAGLILMALQARGLARRVLILAPASLVPQWQERLRQMFDLRFQAYVREADTARSDYWNSNDRVIASFQTLRMKGEAQTRLVGAEPWDLVIADEAHHLGADEERGPTLGFKLVESLQKSNRLRSLLFFTGTPHRGKVYGFLSLMHLVAPDRFNPRHEKRQQFDILGDFFIRNNKQNTTDLQGRRLFQPPIVSSEIYQYSPVETDFYEMLSDFIVTGRAYADTLGERDSRAVMLVLITMQKLASSSVEAVRRALKGRRDKLVALARAGQQKKANSVSAESLATLLNDDEDLDLDEAARAEENAPADLLALALMEDEVPKLEELIEATDPIVKETKMVTLMTMLETRFAGRSILFFTEYKATQALLLGELIAHYGPDAVAFINGDSEVRDVLMPDGKRRTLRMSRDEASDRFNSGKVRFLVSTEAGGEGIDLQERCWTLVHVDLPWNPMRMHQRVGRLNRYGQTKQVEVISLRNPDTVEDRIWLKLNAKIASIMEAFGSAMDDPEDLFHLVLGSVPGNIYTSLYADALTKPRARLADWFDSRTATFSGRESVDLVKDMLGRADKFDFQQTSSQLPQTDLPDLESFFLSVLQVLGRRPVREDDGWRLDTPEAWRQEIGVDRAYDRLHFDRRRVGRAEAVRLLGSGHRLFDLALREALGMSESVTVLRHLKQPVVLLKVVDALGGPAVPPLVLGLRLSLAPERPPEILRDWEVLRLINEYVEQEGRHRETVERAELPQPLPVIVGRYRREILEHVERAVPQMQQPEIRALGALLCAAKEQVG